MPLIWERFITVKGIQMKYIFFVAALFTSSIAHATLLQGNVTNLSSVADPSPQFGTLINFDDGSYSNPVIPDHYQSQGVTSITEQNGNYLAYYGSTQSFPYYISSGDYGDPAWNTDILIEFSMLQAEVGIGIAGPTTVTFQVLDDASNILEGYNFAMQANNEYYYVDHPTNDIKYLRVAGSFIAFDDLQFAIKSENPATIPEPETLALEVMGLELMNLVTLRRRNRQL